jgi:hypothetical protein
MRLFPGEESPPQIKQLESGDRLAVCNGTCDRSKRPLACRIFPFFPTFHACYPFVFILEVKVHGLILDLIIF